MHIRLNAYFQWTRTSSERAANQCNSLQWCTHTRGHCVRANETMNGARGPGTQPIYTTTAATAAGTRKTHPCLFRFIHINAWNIKTSTTERAYTRIHEEARACIQAWKRIHSSMYAQYMHECISYIYDFIRFCTIFWLAIFNMVLNSHAKRSNKKTNLNRMAPFFHE